jgi:hypothetical protein
VDLCVNPSAFAPKLSSDRVSPGGQVTVSGQCVGPHAVIEIYLFSDPIFLGNTTANGTGEYQATVTIPRSVPDGMHHIGVSIAGSSPSLAATNGAALRVGAANSTSGLVRTGEDVIRLLIVGAALLIVGAAMRASRSRRSFR